MSLGAAPFQTKQKVYPPSPETRPTKIEAALPTKTTKWKENKRLWIPKETRANYRQKILFLENLLKPGECTRPRSARNKTLLPHSANWGQNGICKHNMPFIMCNKSHIAYTPFIHSLTLVSFFNNHFKMNFYIYFTSPNLLLPPSHTMSAFLH